VRVIEFTFSSASVGKLAIGLHNALCNRQLALPGDADLLDELSNVRLREVSPGTYRLDHDPDKHDDRAISLALCLQALLRKSAMNYAAAMPLEVVPDSGGGRGWLAEIGGSAWRDEPRPT
jgi:phage FluMu gp28-like protein